MSRISKLSITLFLGYSFCSVHPAFAQDIYVNDGNSTVSVGVDGVHVSDGNGTVRVDAGGVHITDGGSGGNKVIIDEGRSSDRKKHNKHDEKKISYTNSTLKNMSFEGKNLAGVSFTNADLTNINFRNADLRGADFTNAELKHCDLRGASVSGASFTNATFIETKVAGVNFNSADMTNADINRADRR